MSLLESTFDTNSSTVEAAAPSLAANTAREDRVVSRACVHCGQNTPCLESDDARRTFCCSGCRSAYDLIHGWGLDEYYAMREQLRPASVVPYLALKIVLRSLMKPSFSAIPPHSRMPMALALSNLGSKDCIVLRALG